MDAGQAATKLSLTGQLGCHIIGFGFLADITDAELMSAIVVVELRSRNQSRNLITSFVETAP